MGGRTEVVLELIASMGSSSLRVAAKEVSRRTVRNQARNLTRRIVREADQVAHHKNPLFGHPGGAGTTFPTGGLPPAIHSGSWNIKLVDDLAHTAAHNRMRMLDKWFPIVVNPGTTGLRAIGNEQACSCER